MGVFEGALIYFVIYFEKKVSAIYQLFALVWLPLELIILIKYHFSSVLNGDPKYTLVSIVKYALIWALLVALDYVVKNEMAKCVSMCFVTIFMMSTGINAIFYGNVYFYIDIYRFIRWAMVLITLAVLVFIRKKGKKKRCLKCGTDIIDGDLFCRNCGQEVIARIS